MTKNTWITWITKALKMLKPSTLLCCLKFNNVWFASSKTIMFSGRNKIPMKANGIMSKYNALTMYAFMHNHFRKDYERT
jgi:hypothetical protein